MYRPPMNAGPLPWMLRNRVPLGTRYLGEDETYWYFQLPGARYQLGGSFFDNVGNMFSRMVKFTPKSFTPGNIYKGFVNTTLTVASGGAYQLLPKSLKKSVYEIGKVAIPVVAGGVLAVTMGPAIWGVLSSKLSAAGQLLGAGSKVLGGGGGQSAGSDVIGAANTNNSNVPSGSGSFLDTASRTINVGGQLMDLLGKLPQNKQAEVVQALTPEQIAQMERTGVVPPQLQAYLDQMARGVFAPQQASVGSAALYNPFGAVGVPESVGGIDWSLVLLLGVPALFFVMSGKR